MSKNVKDLMGQLIEFDPDTPIEIIQEEIGLYAEVPGKEEPTAKSVLTDLIKVSDMWASWEVDGKECHVQSDFKDYINQKAKQLADLLGIEFEGGI